MLKKRACGVLLHPTSLPGAGGIGTFGDDARRFIDILAKMGMTYWQILPMTPPACGNSPYSAFSAFAGNPLLIDLKQIEIEGDLKESDHQPLFSESHVDYAAVSTFKMELLSQAAIKFHSAEDSERRAEFWSFCNRTNWLHDYALFMAMKKLYKGALWQKWPKEAAILTDETYESASIELGVEIGIQKYIQWQFFRQWSYLHEYANKKGVSIIGDIPIFVAYDSVDVWRNRSLFMLDESGRQTVVAGVPPDYFSATGQLWGNPLYNWGCMKNRGYDWWIERFRQSFAMYDFVRVDHFRGFAAAWQVPATDFTAENGSWVAAPGEELFKAVSSAIGSLPIIAEDLGVISPDVETLRDSFGFPGMKILQFAFGSGSLNPYLPHNHIKNCVVYSGTHDNNTTIGWFAELDQKSRQHVVEYLGGNDGDILKAIIKSALMSVANSVIIPFQDLLCLGSKARMNTPGNAFGNWEWRFVWNELKDETVLNISDTLKLYGRA